MGFIYGLAVFLVIFEGIIIQCEGAGGGESSSRREDAQVTADVEHLKISNPEERKTLLCKCSIEALVTAISMNIVSPMEVEESKRLENHIIEIVPCSENSGKIVEIKEDDNSFLRFNSYEELDPFFHYYGAHVKKIFINLNSHELCDDQNFGFIKTCAKNLKELRIKTDDDMEFWEGLPKNGIEFPKVEKFQLKGTSHQGELNLNIIFPELKYLELMANVADVKCLDNVQGLTELTLHTDSIKEHQFHHIFQNNGNMTMLYLSRPTSTLAMKSIADHLKQLQTLKVKKPGKNFLFGRHADLKYVLSKVKTFYIRFYETADVFGNEEPSFDMPGLQTLIIDFGFFTDNKFVEFTKHFKQLQTMELFIRKTKTKKIDELIESLKPKWGLFDVIKAEKGEKLTFISEP